VFTYCFCSILCLFNDVCTFWQYKTVEYVEYVQCILKIYIRISISASVSAWKNCPWPHSLTLTLESLASFNITGYNFIFFVFVAVTWSAFVANETGLISFQWLLLKLRGCCFSISALRGLVWFWWEGIQFPGGLAIPHPVRSSECGLPIMKPLVAKILQFLLILITRP